MKKTILLVILFLTNIALSQDRSLKNREISSKSAINESFTANLGKISILSPQSYEFMQHGRTPVSLYTGNIDLKIPVYNYNDNDFQIPIYLGYNSSGFIPNKRESIVGLNWFLNAGGAITRKVNGFPDDIQGRPTNSPTTLHGLYYGIKHNLPVKQKSKDCIFNFDSGCSEVIDFSKYWHVGGCEVDPDEFSFNMPGFSGKFFFQNNGEVKCVGNKPFRVELDEFQTQSYYGTDVKESVLKIITDDGYTYHFGGDIQYLEVSYNVTEIHDPKNPVINAWHLNKIVAPNGREVVYSYKQFIKGLGPRSPSDSNHYLLNVNHYTYAEADDVCNSFNGGFCSFQNSKSSVSGVVTDKGNVTKTVYLSNIVIGDTSVLFDYEENEYQFYQEDEFTNHGYNQKTLRLKSINVQNKSKLIKSFSFAYSYKGSNQTKRLFLESFAETGKEPYRFEYYKTNDLPKPTTRGIDYWGYWNGKLHYNSLIPDTNYFQNGDTEFIGNERVANPQLCDVGLLKKLNYPTKGYSEYTYEAHQYSKRLERKNSTNFKPRLFTVSDYAGGARISKIVDNDGTEDTNEREFIYNSNYNTGGSSSSGILLDWPRMFFYWEYNDGDIFQKSMRQKSYSFNSNIHPGEKHIQYAEVVEKNTHDKSFTISKFTNYESNPNFDDHDFGIVDHPYYNYVTNLDLYLSYVDRGFNDKSFERGKLYNLQQFVINPDLSNRLVYENTIDYQPFQSNTDKYVVGVYQTGSIAKSYKHYYYPYLPIQEEEKIYPTENSTVNIPVSKKTIYEYDDKGYLSKKLIKNSKNEDVEITYAYVSNLADQWPQASTLLPDRRVIQKMDEDNMINKPIEVTQRVRNKVTTSKLYNYDFFTGGNIKLANVETLKKSPSQSFVKAFFPNNIAMPFVKDTDYIKKVIYHNYNDVGGATEMSKADGTSLVYIWGYNNTKPVVKVENAKLEDIPHGYINAIKLASNNDTDRTIDTKNEQGVVINYIGNEGNLRKEMNKLFELNALRNSNITLYTYDPLIGVTSITDSRGETIYYHYDQYNRLKYVKNTQGKILKENKYNYKK